MTSADISVIDGQFDGRLGAVNTVYVVEFLNIFTVPCDLGTNLPHTYAYIDPDSLCVKYLSAAETYQGRALKKLDTPMG